MNPITKASFLSRVFRRDHRGKRGGDHLDNDSTASVPRWEESWSRTSVTPEEIQELVHQCTDEIKLRDTSAAKHTIRNYFKTLYEHDGQYTGDGLRHQLRLTDLAALCSILKWCWSRLHGGIVTWDAYELFKVGESDSHFARHAFNTFIPLSVRSQARKQIIFDFFDLLAAISARCKANGFTGRKLPRMGAWWAFELSDSGKGFDGGYRSWAVAADACTHLFFAYLRSLAPEGEKNVPSALPLSLQSLLSQTEYPPETPALLQTTTKKVVMIVDAVSPTPYALLRRAKHFEYRDDDTTLQEFASYEDPVRALTEECCRILQCISTTNESAEYFGGAVEASWSRFEDLGFDILSNAPVPPTDLLAIQARRVAQSATRDGRPTTPSWADFLSSGFDDNKESLNTTLVPPSAQLPPIRGHSSQSHLRKEEDVEPGELASVTQFDLDETFWWVWITSLSSEELADRKAIFGRCTLLETRLRGCRWMVIEEQVKGANPDQNEGTYVVPKRSLFSFSRRGRLMKTKKTPPTVDKKVPPSELAKLSIPADQHALIQKAAAHLREQNLPSPVPVAETSGNRNQSQDRTNSVFALPEAGYALPAALSWAAGGLEDVPEDSQSRHSSEVTTKSTPHLIPLPTKPAQSTATLQSASNIDASSTPSLAPRAPPKSPRTPAPAKHIGAGGTIKQSPTPTADSADKKTSPNPLRNLFGRKPTSDLTISNPIPISVPKVSPPAPKPDVVKTTPAWSPLNISPVNRSQAAAPPPPPAKPAVSTPDPVMAPLPSTDASAQVPASPSPPPPARKPAPPISQPVASLPENLTKSTETFASARSSPRLPTETVSKKPAPADPSPLKTISTNANVGPTGPEAHPSSSSDQFAFIAGPLTDMPAFLPDSDDDSITLPLTPPSGKRTPAATALPPKLPHQVNVRTTSVPNGSAPRALVHQLPTRTNPAEANEQPNGRRPVVPLGHRLPIKANPANGSSAVAPVPGSVNDRWAQIRKNAQERAAKMSDEQRTRIRSANNVIASGSNGQAVPQTGTPRSEADSDTSSEETIESRVARIKARVAELTGNIDSTTHLAAGVNRAE